MSSDTQYSDATRAVLDLALERLSSHLPESTVTHLRKLADEGRLDDASAVLKKDEETEG